MAAVHGRASRAVPVVWGSILLALAYVLWFVIGPAGDQESSPASDRAPATAPAPDSERPPVPGRPRTAPSAKRPQAPTPAVAVNGWIGEYARDVAPRSALRAAPEADPLCQRPASLIERSKEEAMKFERTLRQASAMPDAEEVPIGTAIERKLPTHQAFAGKWDRADDRALYGPYLTSLVGMLARHSTRPGLKYRVHVVREPTFNAMALPGGVLLVHTGLFTGENRVRSEAELVSVLAHEITHVEKRHTVAAYQYARAALGDTADEAAIAVKMMTLPLSTEYEHEADDGGILLAVEAQYDPRAQVDLWRRSAVKEPGRTQILGGLLSTHPPSAERACRAMRRVNWARDNARWDRFYVGRTNLAKRIPGQVRQF